MKSNRESVSRAPSTSSSTTTLVTPGPLEDLGKDFTQLGRQFCVFNEIWVRKQHLRQPYPEELREVGPRYTARYTNKKTKQAGVVAELYDFVPTRFHEQLESSPFFATKVSVILTRWMTLILLPPSSLQVQSQSGRILSTLSVEMRQISSLSTSSPLRFMPRIMTDHKCLRSPHNCATQSTPTRDTQGIALSCIRMESLRGMVFLVEWPSAMLVSNFLDFNI
jgi:hypothetical protein